jgi:hypothetical protein
LPTDHFLKALSPAGQNPTSLMPLAVTKNEKIILSVLTIIVLLGLIGLMLL